MIGAPQMIPSPRKRLSPDESRAAALNAARTLLITSGPQAVTLKAVAAKVGRTHANVLHHFGSADGLQRALADKMAQATCAAITEVTLHARKGEANPAQIVDMCFDAFDREGFGQLASWMIVTGHRADLQPIMEAIHHLVDVLTIDSGPEYHDSIAKNALNLIFLSMSNALLGKELAAAVGLSQSAARELALEPILRAPTMAKRPATA